MCVHHGHVDFKSAATQNAMIPSQEKADNNEKFFNTLHIWPQIVSTLCLFIPLIDFMLFKLRKLRSEFTQGEHIWH